LVQECQSAFATPFMRGGSKGRRGHCVPASPLFGNSSLFAANDA